PGARRSEQVIRLRRGRVDCGGGWWVVAEDAQGHEQAGEQQSPGDEIEVPAAAFGHVRTPGAGSVVQETGMERLVWRICPLSSSAGSRSARKCLEKTVSRRGAKSAKRE